MSDDKDTKQAWTFSFKPNVCPEENFSLFLTFFFSVAMELAFISLTTHLGIYLQINGVNHKREKEVYDLENGALKNSQPRLEQEDEHF